MATDYKMRTDDDGLRWVTENVAHVLRKRIELLEEELNATRTLCETYAHRLSETDGVPSDPMPWDEHARGAN